jgi:hypothetical protein
MSKHTRHVQIEEETAVRLRKIGGTLTRGIYLASFGNDINLLLKLATTHETKAEEILTKAEQEFLEPVLNLSEVAAPALAAIKPLTALQKQNPAQVMAKRREQFIAWGFDPVIVEHADVATLEAMARQVAEGTAPAQLAAMGTVEQNLLADWDEFDGEGQ